MAQGSTWMRRCGVAAGVVVLGLASLSAGQTAPAGGEQDVRAELDALRAQVEAQDQELRQLRQVVDAQRASERRPAEVDKAVREAAPDAEARSRPLGGGLTAGYDKKFFLRSADNNFLLNIGGFTQLRYVANSREDAEDSIGTTDDEEFGFQIRRAKLQLGGHVISPKLPYFLQIAANRDTGAVELEVATAGYKFTDKLELRAGRYKAGFLLEEEDVSATRQLAVERSLVNSIFTVHYVEGAELLLDPNDWLHLHASFNDGLRSGDAGGTGNDFQNDAAEYALTARAELKLAGDWTQKADFVAWSGEGTALLVGGGLHYEVAETGDSQAAAPGVDDFFMYTLDGQFKSNGFSAFAAFMGRYVNVTDGAATGNLNDFGAVAQVGYMVIPDKLAPFIRYEWISPDDARGFNDMNLITAGVNYYFKKHSAKLTLDVVWALDELNDFAFTSTPYGTPSATSRSGLGLLPDSPGSDDQVVFRAQFQLMF
jgi:Phosphate-selective porin O and P